MEPRAEARGDAVMRKIELRLAPPWACSPGDWLPAAGQAAGEDDEVGSLLRELRDKVSSATPGWPVSGGRQRDDGVLAWIRGLPFPSWMSARLQGASRVGDGSLHGHEEWS